MSDDNLRRIVHMSLNELANRIVELEDLSVVGGNVDLIAQQRNRIAELERGRDAALAILDEVEADVRIADTLALLAPRLFKRIRTALEGKTEPCEHEWTTIPKHMATPKAELCPKCNMIRAVLEGEGDD